MFMSRHGGTGLILSLSLAATVTGCAKKQEGMEAMAPVQQVQPPKEVSASEVTQAVQSLPQPDRSFVEQAAGANVSAIRFGQLAMERGSTDGIRELGRNMVDTHSKMSDDLRQSAAAQGITLPLPSMTEDQRGRYEKLAKLQGTEFDRAYLDEIRNMQQQTIASFQEEAMRGQVPAIQKFANESLPVLNDRVRTVQREMNRF